MASASCDLSRSESYLTASLSASRSDQRKKALMSIAHKVDYTAQTLKESVKDRVSVFADVAAA